MTAMPLHSARPAVSVIIPTYNRCGLLAATLDNLVRQRMPAGAFEVVVADDGSSDATAAVVDAFRDRLPIRYVFQEDRGFRAALARNTGARLATGAVLVFLDTGALPGPDFLASHAAQHACPAQHRAVLGDAYGWRPGDPQVMAGLPEAVAELPPEEVVDRFRYCPGLQDERREALRDCAFEDHPLPWTMFLGLNFSVRAADFWAVGGFDESFHGYGFEDMELGYRLQRHGVGARLTSDAWVVESPHERDMRRNMGQAAANLDRFLRRHPDPSVELVWYAFHHSSIWRADTHHRELADWRGKAARVDVTAELVSALDRVEPGARVAVLGGGGIPPALLATRPGTAVLDFDRDLLDASLGGPAVGYHAIGLRTPLADGAVDTVLVTSRMAGLWEHWGDALLAEAQRIGRDVRVL
jgi:glycosyltransferase involved in cell wall biosynthesis